jgi:hypothetical protein
VRQGPIADATPEILKLLVDLAKAVSRGGRPILARQLAAKALVKLARRRRKRFDDLRVSRARDRRAVISESALRRAVASDQIERDFAS